MEAASRLTAGLAVALAASLVLSVPNTGSAGLAILVGWVGVLLLAAGLLAGITGAVTAAALALIVQLTIAAALPDPVSPPLWAQAALVTLVIELATISFQVRRRPIDLAHASWRAIGLAATAGLIVAGLEAVLAGVIVGGTMVRALGMGALVVAGGALIVAWRRAAPGSVEGDR